MKTLKNLLITIPLLALSLNVNAQKDGCGCVKEIINNQIKIPYAKDGITIQFFYPKTGKYKNVILSGTEGLVSQVVYDTWEEVIHDFPSSSKDFALIKFDWNKLAKFDKHHNWKSVVNNVEGKTYIGLWLDMSINLEANKIKIADIKTSCFYPRCSPNTYVFTIGVNLEDK